MATPRDLPWSNDEKNYLLAEIIKAQSPPSNVLLNVVNTIGVANLRWDDLILPPRRSLNSCRHIFDEMRRQQPPPQPNLPYPPPAPKRTLADPQQYGGGREIRPKPTPSSSYGQPSSGEPPIKRKRGRPPKAALQARAAAEAARMAQQAPLASSASGMTPVSPRPPSVGAASTEERPTAPLTRGMDLQSMLRTPPRQTTTASQSSSSSGKRRRVRAVQDEEQQAASISGEYFHEPAPSRPPSGTEDSSLPRPMYHYYATESGSPTRSSPRAAQPPVQTQPSASQPPLNPS